MPIPTTMDRFGADHSSTAEGAISLFEEATLEILRHGRRTPEVLLAVRAEDPHHIGAIAAEGLGLTLLAKPELAPAISQCLAQARRQRVDRGATTFEDALIHALELAAAGMFRSAAERLEAHPTSILAFKIAHQLRFMIGDAIGMASAAEQFAKRSESSHVIGCLAFAQEELGRYDEAEQLGRRATELDPADAWAGHAVAHVYEMQNLPALGRRWIEMHRGDWAECNNFGFHIEWHYALFLLEQGRLNEVLDHYDRKIRPTPTDDFRDCANAVSLLARLEQSGVDVGARWAELTEIARRRIDDRNYVFASLHHLIAFLAVNDKRGATDLLHSLELLAETSVGEQGAVAREVGVPLARWLIEQPAALDLSSLMRDLPLMGGSNAQRDIFVRSLIIGVTRSGDHRMAAHLSELRHQLKADSAGFSHALARAGSQRHA